MEREDWLDRVASIRSWKRGGERAPHKPLLLLYAPGRLERTGSSRVSFVDAEPEMQELLEEFGPPHRTSPAYPFHHLQTDGLWEVRTADGTDPGAAVGKLRQSGAIGELAPDFERAILADPGLAALIVHHLLDDGFPESLHSDICDAAGLDVDRLESTAARDRGLRLVARRPARDPAFRREVMAAYDHRCAMCGFDGRLGRDAVGLEAAHVKWWAFDGPDTMDNGLCLCALHHKLFDRGVLGVSDALTVEVSPRFTGLAPAASTVVLDLLGREVLAPRRGVDSPSTEHLSWHREQVFRGPDRSVA